MLMLMLILRRFGDRAEEEGEVGRAGSPGRIVDAGEDEITGQKEAVEECGFDVGGCHADAIRYFE